METTELLFFALAILFVAGVVVLDRRLGRIQAGLSRLDELAGLSQRVASLTAQFERKEVSPQLEAKLTEIAEAERRTVSALAELTREVSELRRAAERRAAAAPPEPPAADPASLAREHLLAQGYEDVRLVSDPATLDGPSGRVVFEACKRGVMHKGQLRLSDGRVVDESVRAAYSTFP